jgi:hypothetical protein
MPSPRAGWKPAIRENGLQIRQFKFVSFRVAGILPACHAAFQAAFGFICKDKALTPSAMAVTPLRG